MAITTAIFTNNQKTTLTIDAPEAVNLVQMGDQGKVIVVRALREGENEVPVGVGVFMVLSNDALRVTADAEIYVASTSARGKDVGFPDPPKVKALENAAIREFFATARSGDVPR